MKKRIEWVDVVKFMCILCVMLTHLECCPTILYNFYYPFYLAAFFFCSGYCYRKVDNFGQLLKKKVKQLLIPWFIFSNANILISHIISIKEHNNLSIELFRNLLQVRGYDERLWFLVSLFVTFIPFYFLTKYFEEKRINERTYIIIALILFLIKKVYSWYFPVDILPWGSNKLPWHIDYIGTSLLSMALGYIYKNKYENILSEKTDLTKKAILFIIYVLLIILGNVINIRFNFIFYVIYDLITQVIGIFAIITICKCIKPNKFILFVGQNTLVYFCIHNKFETLIEYSIIKLIPNIYDIFSSSSILSIPFSLLLVLLISTILIIPTKVLNKYFTKFVGK